MESDVARIEGEAAEAASKAAESITDPPGQVTLSNGIKLRVKRVPPLLMRRAATQIQPPKVPTVYLEEKGREEPNPSHPDYLVAMAEYRQRQDQAVVGVMFITGTSILEVPEGVPAVDDGSWLEKLEAAGIELSFKSEPARYLAWLQYVAIETLQDMISIGLAIGRLSGVQEADVATAMDSFRSYVGRGTDNDVEFQERATDGAELSPIAGRNGAGD